MTEKRLHPAQEKLIEILTKNADQPLTIREMQDLIGASSTSVVVHHMAQLEKKGYLRDSRTSRRLSETPG